MLDCLYQVVKNFQTLFVGVLGFSSVIFTLLMNSRLSWKQHERNIKHDREVLRTALRAELELNRRSFSENAASAEVDHEVSDAFFRAETQTKIYQHFIGKLGLLTTEEVSAVIEAYSLIDEIPARLGLLSGEHDSSYNKPGYIYIKAPESKKASGIYKSFLPSIETALKKLGDY